MENNTPSVSPSQLADLMNGKGGNRTPHERRWVNSTPQGFPSISLIFSLHTKESTIASSEYAGIWKYVRFIELHPQIWLLASA